MIYIKRILWLIGLIPVCFLLTVWVIVETTTIPLKMLIQVLIKGKVDDKELECATVYSLSSAKKLMKEHPGSVGDKIKIYCKFKNDKTKLLIHGK